MNTTELTTDIDTIRISAHHAVTKRLGHWTTARRFDVRAHRGSAVLDLRSPRIPDGDIEVTVDLNVATLTLLVPDDAVVDDWDLRRVNRGGQVKDRQRQDIPAGRRITVRGVLSRGEIRVHRSGVAVLSALCSREFLADLRRSRQLGVTPTVADPAHSA